MKKTGMGLALAGVWTVCMAVGSEPIAVKVGIAGLVILVAGLAMVLYQSYQEEEIRNQERQRRKMFRKWVDTTDLKEGRRCEDYE